MDIITMIPLFIGGARGAQLLIVILLVILLFGSKRIPSLMKNLGKSVHSFKQGMAEAESEMKKPVKLDNEKEEKIEKDKDND